MKGTRKKMRILLARMIARFNAILDNFSVRFGAQYRISRGTEVAAVSAFFKNFRPFDNGHDLIRIGAENDGGYLVPDDLVGITSCFSPGVGNSWDFEKQLAEVHGIPSHMLDDSVEPPKDLTTMQSFISQRLGTFSTSGQLSIESWLDLSEPMYSDKDFLLQMDIESHEWLCLLSVPTSILSRFRIIVVEFHSFPLTSNPWLLMNIYNPVIIRLLELFDIVHCHPNNAVGTFRYLGIEFPDTLEVTFHRKDRAKISLTPRALPNPLDSECVPSCPSVVIDHIF